MMEKTDKVNPHTFFQPAFGNRPDQYIGRDGEIDRFMEGLRGPIGSRNRCTLFLGQRGMGKTALQPGLSDRAARVGYVVARVFESFGTYRRHCDHSQIASGFGEEGAGNTALPQTVA